MLLLFIQELLHYSYNYSLSDYRINETMAFYLHHQRLIFLSSISVNIVGTKEQGRPKKWRWRNPIFSFQSKNNQIVFALCSSTFQQNIGSFFPPSGAVFGSRHKRKTNAHA